MSAGSGKVGQMHPYKNKILNTEAGTELATLSKRETLFENHQFCLSQILPALLTRLEAIIQIQACKIRLVKFDLDQLTCNAIPSRITPL